MINILIADDEKPIADLLKMGMSKAGYHCVCVYDGNSAIEEVEKQPFDLILLDVMMPGIDGFELMEYIKDFNIPVVFLTAKTSLNDKLKGLHLGAEDYIVKPFEMLEVSARVEGILRRHGKLQDIITIDDLEINTSAMTVEKSGEEIILTKKEYDLLLMFARNPGIVLYKQTIYENVWGGDYPESTRTVELHVQRLKKKLDWSDKIKAVYTVGYRLVVSP
ncbi:MAG: response regulator transcription factor [Lachnospiraceae bacterium]|nr:response regulator transcription factor [Lachnospiraceae bacterium]